MFKKNKGFFVGECDQITGKFHGKGVCLFESGDLFEGHFSNGKPHGHGRMVRQIKHLLKIVYLFNYFMTTTKYVNF